MKPWLRIALLLSLAAMAEGAHPISDSGAVRTLSVEYSFSSSLNLTVVTGTFQLTNQFKEDLCIPKDVMANNISPFVIIKNGHEGEGVPNPPLLSGDETIKPGSIVKFKKVIAYMDPGEKGHASIEVMVKKCEDQSVIMAPSSVLSLLNPLQ